MMNITAASRRPASISFPRLSHRTFSAPFGSSSHVKISPSAHYIIESNKLNVSLIKPTGPRGHITKGDVLSFLKSPKQEQSVRNPSDTKTASAPQQQYTEIPNNNVRKVIARRLTESKTNIPHLYLSDSCQIDNLLNARATLAKEGIKVSVNDFIIRALSLALRTVPEANAAWSVTDGAAKLLPTVDISVAVATDYGLITPIVWNADQKGVKSISNDIQQLAAKARNKKLEPKDYQGGTFSVSNLGMFGIDEFVAVINPPQSGILAVGRAFKKPFSNPLDEREEGDFEIEGLVTQREDKASESGLTFRLVDGKFQSVASEINGENASSVSVVEVVPTSHSKRRLEIATYVTLTLSCDSRVVDEELGRRLLRSLQSFLADPYLLM
eukprot:TRINITY_DN8892_c0_g1_i1.p1 TRINITY_DN8892_c0_g1~~TRINITY_DN8892_c0_g1_i1.p1  ORF type:complete len:384 (-),score=87.34 TRINITY_DN8892_c0_g1_i1:213-1364(-)